MACHLYSKHGYGYIFVILCEELKEIILNSFEINFVILAKNRYGYSWASSCSRLGGGEMMFMPTIQHSLQHKVAFQLKS